MMIRKASFLLNLLFLVVLIVQTNADVNPIYFFEVDLVIQRLTNSSNFYVNRLDKSLLSLSVKKRDDKLKGLNLHIK